jgi:pimeloyl-ACP methyl ester carboxylesterase
MSMQSSLGAVSALRSPEQDAERPGYFAAGTGVPIVMLHSSLSSKSQWIPLADRLASRFRVIGLDLCGYGDNPAIDASATFTLDDEVRLIAAHLDRLVGPGVRVHMVGHSYGGLVALRFAQVRSERIASLSLYEPVAFRMLDDDDTTLAELKRIADQVHRLVAAGRHREAAHAFVDFWSGEGSYASMALPVQAKLARRTDKITLDFQAAWQWPRSAVDLRAIVAPTLLLFGNRSPAIAQRLVARLTRALADPSVCCVDAGHMGPITDAHRVNPWIEAFVDICAERADSAAMALTTMRRLSISAPSVTAQP